MKLTKSKIYDFTGHRSVALSLRVGGVSTVYRKLSKWQRVIRFLTLSL